MNIVFQKMAVRKRVAWSFIAFLCCLGAARGADVSSAFSRLPLAFQPNRGQFPADVRYAGRGSGLTVYLTDSEAVLALRDASPVRMKWRSARPRFTPIEILKSKSNYYLGNDPAQWHTDVPNYAQLKLEDLYPGIDLVYHGCVDSLEFDFVVAPGADPSAIEMDYEGADAVRLADGDLVLATHAGEIRQLRPRVYQEIDGRRVEVAGAFRLNGHRVRFQLARYDRTRTLVIDPVFVYQNNAAGTAVTGVTVDAAGNLYAAGTGSISATPGVFQSAVKQIFVMKLDPSGALVYATYLGGQVTFQTRTPFGAVAFGTGIAVDSAGNAYVAGGTDDETYPTTPGALKPVLPGPANPTLARGQNAFVSKLNSTGTALLYSTFLGGDGGSSASGIAVDAAGAAYLTGAADANFPTTAGSLQATSASCFVGKLNGTGTALLYSTYFNADKCSAIAIDSSGASYITGSTSSTFPATAGAFQQSPRGNGDAFAVKLNPAGSALLYATLLGGGNLDSGVAIALDTNGNAYIAGSTYSTDFPVTPGAYATTLTGRSDGFVAKLSANGSSLVYSTYLGGAGDERLTGIAIDPSGVAYLAGSTSSSNFPVTPDASTSQANISNDDNVLARLNPQGTGLLYSTYLDGASSVTLDNSGNAYVGGSARDPGPILTFSGFLAKLAFTSPTPLAAFTTSPAPSSLAAASFTVSGAGCAPGVYQAPVALAWTPGSVCSVSVSNAPFQFGQAGRYGFASWADGGTGNPRTFVAPSTATTYIANLGVQYPLSGTSVPPGAGAFSANPSSPDGYYNTGTAVQVTAFPGPGYSFSAFVGGLTGTANPQTVTMTGSMFLTIDFCSYTLTPAAQAFSASSSTASASLQTPAGCGWSAGSDSSWITPPPATSGSGSILLNYAVAANTGPSQRIGHLTVLDSLSGSARQVTITQAGSSSAQIPALVSLSPFQGTGAFATLTLVYGHPNGWSAIRSAEFIVNPRWEANGRAGGCYVKYAPATGLFTLITNDGSSIAGTAAAGSSISLSNSQCTLNAANSSATGSGNTLTVAASLTFQPTFTGQRHIWMQAVDYNNFSTNWLVYGVWLPTGNTVNAIPWNRIYDPFSKSYLYSADQNEYNVLGLEGFVQQGISGLVMDSPGTVGGISNIAWYRLYVNSTNSHFWTSDRNEFLTLVNAQQAYVGEGVAAFVMPYINAQGLPSPQVSNTIPFYRAAFQGKNLHFWTADPNEFFGSNGKSLPAGYVGEGIASYIFPATGAQGLNAADFAGGLTPPAVSDDGSPAVVLASPGVVSPGQRLSIYGRRLSGTVLLNGIPVQAIPARDNEIQVVVPEDLAGASELSLQVEHGGRRSKPVTLGVVPANPVIFGTNPYGRGNAQALNDDGTTNDARHPAARGSVVTLYTTGFRAGTGADLQVEVHIGGHPAEVLSTRLSATRAGVMEVRVRVPETVEAAPFQPVVLHFGNTFSQPGVGLAIR